MRNEFMASVLNRTGFREALPLATEVESVRHLNLLEFVRRYGEPRDGMEARPFVLEGQSDYTAVRFIGQGRTFWDTVWNDSVGNAITLDHLRALFILRFVNLRPGPDAMTQYITVGEFAEMARRFPKGTGMLSASLRPRFETIIDTGPKDQWLLFELATKLSKTAWLSEAERFEFVDKLALSGISFDVLAPHISSGNVDMNVLEHSAENGIASDFVTHLL